MSQEGVAASQADLVAISADGLKGWAAKAGYGNCPVWRANARRHKQLLAIDDIACSAARVRRRRSSNCGKKRAVALMRPALVRHFAVNDAAAGRIDALRHHPGAMRLPLINLLPSGDEILRHIWLTIRLPRVLLALLVGARWRLIRDD